MGWFGPDDWAVAALFLALPVAAFVWLRRAERRARRDWWRMYYREGGLVRSLMARWRGVPRLTDGRDRTDGTD